VVKVNHLVAKSFANDELLTFFFPLKPLAIDENMGMKMDTLLYFQPVALFLYLDH
jgi:hypothetical protein